MKLIIVVTALSGVFGVGAMTHHAVGTYQARRIAELEEELSKAKKDLANELKIRTAEPVSWALTNLSQSAQDEICLKKKWQTRQGKVLVECRSGDHREFIISGFDNLWNEAVVIVPSGAVDGVLPMPIKDTSDPRYLKYIPK